MPASCALRPMEVSSARIRRCLAAVWVLWSERNFVHARGPCHCKQPDSNGEIPCMAATARAIIHSCSCQFGALWVGFASSRASLSVTWQMVGCSSVGGGITTALEILARILVYAVAAEYSQ